MMGRGMGDWDGDADADVGCEVKDNWRCLKQINMKYLRGRLVIMESFFM
jgi:hypothetical protein